jgi:hypothetical protein
MKDVDYVLRGGKRVPKDSLNEQQRQFVAVLEEFGKCVGADALAAYETLVRRAGIPEVSARGGVIRTLLGCAAMFQVASVGADQEGPEFVRIHQRLKSAYEDAMQIEERNEIERQ